ncbi:hypothetical protein AOQ84DRAFT_444170 [Glonium stellatum]|uniref:Pheromone receptor n=1 Tax=Glonium stellatum TaxID=574774 RepID=A0A8E2EMR1_9PEZI|nr:hypothetical protein AOQ84DRAFT_444170 [Glonium stellatum]
MESVSYPLYPEAVVLSVLGGITVILGIPPFIWHFLQHNVAATSLVFWVTLLNLTNFINPILWPRDNVSDWWKGQILCDIEVRLFVGSTVALPGALACIMRKLAKVMDTKNIVMAPSRAQRIREAVLEILCCFGFPILLMLIYYIVQPIRYFLWGISGCNTAFDNSWPSVVLVMMWSPIVSLVGAYYSGLLIFRLYRYRTEFTHLLRRHKTTKSRFLRLFIMSFIMILIILPLQFYILFKNVQLVSAPYSWSNVHGPNWNEVITLPSFGVVIFDRWIRVADGFLVFLAFGTGTDAGKLYRSWLIWMKMGKAFPSLYRSHGSEQSQKGSGWSLSNKAKRVFSQQDSHPSLLSPTTTRSASSIPISTTDQLLPPSNPLVTNARSLFSRLFTTSKSRQALLPLFSNKKSNPVVTEPNYCDSLSTSITKPESH